MAFKHVSQLINQAEELINAGATGEAESICEYLIHGNPECVEAFFLSGNIAFGNAKWLVAAERYRRASLLDQGNPVIMNNYGLALLEAGRSEHRKDAILLTSAIEIFEHALTFNPDYISALLNLALAHKELGNYVDAINCYGKALCLDPHNDDAWMQLGSLHTAAYDFDKAIDCYLHLLDLTPNDPAEVMSRIATLYCYIGENEKSDDCFRKAVELSSIPEQRRHYASNRLFNIHYLPDITPEEIAAAHYLWDRTFFQHADTPEYINSPDPDRIIRIGYVSGDFRMNAVSFFIQPVLAAHDQDRFAVYCYSNVSATDLVTEQLIHNHPIIWREITDIADDDACTMIMDDRIDILVDLSGHCGEHRLPLFALRPAPVQITWIGYPDTTGLSSIDYRITDAKADPPGCTEHLHTEQLIRLPRSFLCYNPGEDFPAEGALPCKHRSYICFGTMSNYSKANKPLLELWCRILGNVPDSRLMLRYRGREWERINRKLGDILESNGISASRLILLGHARSVVEQMEAYQSIDIALDTFPYHGTTTTCEALYMGVPVITLAGRSHFSRVGVSMLETVGLQDFIANDPAEYVEKAVALAANFPLLTALRRNLRSMLLNSPLCDNVTFTAQLEEAYRSIWIRWCNNVAQQ